MHALAAATVYSIGVEVSTDSSKALGTGSMQVEVYVYWQWNIIIDKLLWFHGKWECFDKQQFLVKEETVSQYPYLPLIHPLIGTLLYRLFQKETSSRAAHEVPIKACW